MFSKKEIKQRYQDERAQGRHAKSGYNLAFLIVSSALFYNVDKANKDYLDHLTDVARRNKDSESRMTIAIMHDLIEDTADLPEDQRWTYQDLRDVGFSERVIAGIDGMTHRPGEPYFDFIVRGSLNPDTLAVKMSDLESNMTESRNNYLLTEKDHERINKYIMSYNYLDAVRQGEIAPGTKFGDWLKLQDRKLQGPEGQGWALFDKFSGEKRPSAPAAATSFNQPVP